MTNHSASITAFILVGSILFCACGSNRQDNSKSGSSNKTDTTQAVQSTTSTAATAVTTTIHLSSVVVSASAITAIKKKNVMFVYYTTSSSLVLRGWFFKKITASYGQFNTPPDIVLNPEGSDQVVIGDSAYLGNQVLLRKDAIKIDSIIGARTANLHFKPIYNAATGKISYKISIEILTDGTNQFLDDTFFTNPTPPHQAFD